MASSLLALLDDIALNAQQVTGLRADRELPVVWAVARGSLVSEALLVPAALLLGTFAPWAVVPLMIQRHYPGFESFDPKQADHCRATSSRSSMRT